MAKKILSDGSEMEQVFNKQFFGFPMMFLTVYRHLKDRQMLHLKCIISAWNSSFYLCLKDLSEI